MLSHNWTAVTLSFPSSHNKRPCIKNRTQVIYQTHLVKARIGRKIRICLFDRNSIRFVLLGHKPSRPIRHRKTVMKEIAQNVNVENPNMGKTTAAHGLQSITMRGIQRWGTETTISCSLASPTGGYSRGNDLFLSSLSLCIQLRSTWTCVIQLYNNNNKDCPRSYLY